MLRVHILSKNPVSVIYRTSMNWIRGIIRDDFKQLCVWFCTVSF
jgi:hypothetical protein